MEQRAAQARSLKDSGVDPFPAPQEAEHDQSFQLLEEMNGSLPNLGESPASPTHRSVFGRLLQLNNLGKLKFLFLRCPGGDVQVCVSSVAAPEAAQLLRSVSLGDHLAVTGHLARTARGAAVLFASQLRVTAKMLRPLPGKAYSAIVDDEWRANNRVADMMLHQSVLDRLKARAAAMRSIRQTLHSFNFVEVETPVLNQIAGGAAARPFMTHHNALSRDMSLRIAPELDLKRLIIAGLDRVYELGRVFRNEGIDKTHNPEFTTLEMYASNFSLKMMISVLQHTLRAAARATSQVIPESREAVSRFESDFHIVSMRSLVREVCGESPISAEEKPSLEEIAALPDYASLSLGESISDYGEALQALFEKYVEKTLIEPTIVSDHPASTSPLAKCDGLLALRFELYINGFEVANSYVEQADATIQREIFLKQAAKNGSAADMRYCDDLELGLPPTVGLGLGVDRLMMVLTDSQSIRDVIAFPTR